MLVFIENQQNVWLRLLRFSDVFKLSNCLAHNKQLIIVQQSYINLRIASGSTEPINMNKILQIYSRYAPLLSLQLCVIFKNSKNFAFSLN